MDKGAHFHRCDFQVHSPRDANWDGAGAATAAERASYADELVQACRARGIHAIAITDHHDFVFFPYVRAAAAHEVDAVGSPIPIDQQLVVFPGVEVTLSSPPCQVLVILGADTNEAHLNDVLVALAIAPTPAADNKLGSVQHVSPQSVSTLNDLDDKLSLQANLRGRFIILPNVTEGGHKTLLREGFSPHYKEMRCVGGYVDGDYIAKTSEGKRNILEGRQQNNGYKPIAVIQTSDARRRDHSTLGSFVTWIKWAEPTAEALRQACLARESRLSLGEPELPRVWITSLSVSNSRFLGRIELDLNQQYNAIIGGRGTGKSTILEYLRWGLCDEALDSEELDSVQGKRKSLIENTLSAFDGEVHVTFRINDVEHIVKRSSKKKEIVLRIGSAPFAAVTEEQIRSLLPIQAHSQKQLSSVAVRVEELRRFVELPVRDSLDKLDSTVKDIQAQARSAYNNLVRKRQIDGEIEKADLEVSSLTKQAEALRKGLKGLSEDDQKTIERKPLFDNEEALIDDLETQVIQFVEAVGELERQLPAIEAQEADGNEAITNVALIKDVRSSYQRFFAQVADVVQTLKTSVDPIKRAEIDAAVAKWTKEKTAFDAKYDTASKAATANEQQLAQINVIDKKVADLRKSQSERRGSLASIGDPAKLYKDLKQTWDAAHVDRRNQLKTQCDTFSALSDGLIKAEIGGSLDAGSLAGRLKVAFAGMNVKEDKVDKICAQVANAPDPVAHWNVVLGELELLALHDNASGVALPSTPNLSAAGVIDSERQRVATNLNPGRWIDLSLSPLEFNPRFSYCTNKKKLEYIPFADASAGQQATALLAVLLNQPGAPLVIDQPEDDIDSKMIGEIVEKVWRSKKKRQLVFASHSANFVVNGDAELVACCDYVRAGDQTHGAIKIVGAIDVEAVRKEITLVTEGGEPAFRLRKAKYGF